MIILEPAGMDEIWKKGEKTGEVGGPSLIPTMHLCDAEAALCFQNSGKKIQERIDTC